MVLTFRPAGLILRAAMRVLLIGYDYLLLYLGLAWLGGYCAWFGRRLR